MYGVIDSIIYDEYRKEFDEDYIKQELNKAFYKILDLFGDHHDDITMSYLTAIPKALLDLDIL